MIIRAWDVPSVAEGSPDELTIMPRSWFDGNSAASPVDQARAAMRWGIPSHASRK
jgi:hypothetical protein